VQRGVDVVVEILAFSISQPPSRHWEAVRVHDGDRAVWRGPNRDCARDALVRFIDALLASPRELAAARYCLLG
jgi:hypothetical protein